MSKYEFMEQLDNALVGKVSEKERRESIRYYEEYIDDEIGKGKTEKEVLSSLGSPGAIAKSIIDAKGYDKVGESVYEGYNNKEGSSYEKQGYEEQMHTSIKKIEGWKVWAVLGGIVLVLFFMLSLVFKIVAAILPFVIPFVIILFILKLIFGR